MPTTAAAELLRQLIQGILSDPAKARAYSEDPSEYLAAHGVTDHDLTDVDMRSLVVEVAKQCELSEPVMESIDKYAEPGPAPVGRPEPAARPDPTASPAPPSSRPEPAMAKEILPPPVEPPMGQSPLQMIEQHISYITYVTHENNTDIVNNLIDNSTNVDNSSNVSFEVGGSVYGDIDLTNEVSNTTATGDGAVAVGGDVRDSNVNTGSGDVTSVGSIHAEGSAVSVGGDATNTDNSVTDNSTNVNVQDSFNTDNSTNVNVQDSFNDNSTDDNSVDNSTNIDVNLGGGRPLVGSNGDPGFGRGDTGRDPGGDRPSGDGYDPGSAMDRDPYVRDGTPEQYDEKYGNGPESSGRQAEPAGYEAPAEVLPTMLERPIEPIVPVAEPGRERPAEAPGGETEMMD